MTNEKFANEIRTILNNVKFHPTGDNCQPFSFKLNNEEKKIEIFHDSEIAHHQLNYKNLSSMIALGTMLTYFEIAASEFSYRIKFSLNDLSGHHWGTVTLEQDHSITPSPLIDYLKKRCTNRNKYIPKNIDHTELFNGIEKHPGIHISFLDPKHDKEFTHYAASCEGRLWIWKEIMIQTLNWVRFSQKEIHQTKDGMPWRHLGIDWVLAQWIRLTKKFSCLLDFMRLIQAPKIITAITEANIKSASSLVLFGLKKTDHNDLIEFGKVLARFWLNTTKLGIEMQPHAASAIFFIMPETLHGTSSFVTKSFHEQIKNGKDIWKKRIGSDYTPIMCMRMGGTKKTLSDKARTIRKDLSSLGVDNI